MRAGNYLWVVDDSGHLRNRKVTLLRTGGDFVYVSAGLDNGDRVSLTTLDGSFDSAVVRIESSTPSNRLDSSGRPTAPPDTEQASVTAAVEPDVKTDEGG
jgi:hypothetical protein